MTPQSLFQRQSVQDRAAAAYDSMSESLNETVPLLTEGEERDRVVLFAWVAYRAALNEHADTAGPLTADELAMAFPLHLCPCDVCVRYMWRGEP